MVAADLSQIMTDDNYSLTMSDDDLIATSHFNDEK